MGPFAPVTSPSMINEQHLVQHVVASKLWHVFVDQKCCIPCEKWAPCRRSLHCCTARILPCILYTMLCTACGCPCHFASSSLIEKAIQWNACRAAVMGGLNPKTSQYRETDATADAEKVSAMHTTQEPSHSNKHEMHCTVRPAWFSAIGFRFPRQYHRKQQKSHVECSLWNKFEGSKKTESGVWYNTVQC